MVMELVQVRLPKKLVKEINKAVEEEGYATKSDFIREALRRRFAAQNLKSLIGIMPNTGDSVKEIRELRKRLSKEDPEMKQLKYV